MSEMDNPFECGLGKYVDLEAEVESISLPALRNLHGKHKKLLVGIAFPEVVDVPGLTFVEQGRVVGRITAQTWSPKYNEFIMFAMMDRDRVESCSEISVNGVTGFFVPLARYIELQVLLDPIIILELVVVHVVMVVVDLLQISLQMPLQPHVALILFFVFLIIFSIFL